MRRFWILVLLVSLGLNLGLGLRLLSPSSGPDGALHPDSGAAAAGRRGGGGPHRGAAVDSLTWERLLDRRLAHLTARLDLRPDQVGAFRDIQRELGGELQDARRELASARVRLRGTLAAGPIDRTRLRADLAAVGRRQAAVDSLVAESLLRELAILEPGQRDAYLDFLPDHEGPGSGRGRRGGGRHGR